MATSNTRDPSGWIEDGAVIGIFTALGAYLAGLVGDQNLSVAIIGFTTILGQVAATALRNWLGGPLASFLGARPMKSAALKTTQLLALCALGLSVLHTTGCAGSKPPALEYGIAVESYTAAVNAAAPVIDQTLDDGSLSEGTVELVAGTFNAARVARNATTAIVRECEAWTAANGGDENCPQAVQIRAATSNVNDAAEALQRIVDAILED